MSRLITVTNGTDFYRVDASDVSAVKREGYYRPSEKNHTIVSNGEEILEIHRRDLHAAVKDGYREILSQADNAFTESAAAVSDRKGADRLGPEPSKTDRNSSTSTSLSFVQEIEQAESAFEEALEQHRRSVEEATGFKKVLARIALWWFDKKHRLLPQMKGTGASIAVHIGLILLLASFFIVNDSNKPKSVIIATAVDSEVIVEDLIEPVELTVEEPVEEVEPVSERPEVVAEVTETLVSVDFAESLDANFLSMPEASGGKSEGDGDKAMEKPEKAKVQFFGSKTEAIDFVFVIDNSNSMTRGRFETALNELIKAVMQLSAKQKFYVIFYSDTAYPLFHPYGARTLVPATPINKQRLVQWLGTVQLCLRTDGIDALKLGFSLEPDVMFVLGDGAFTDKAATVFSKNPVPDVIVHTLGMEVSPQKAIGFAALAKAHNGTYRDVGVHPAAAIMHKQSPRKKNNQRNGIWGLKLPVKPNK